MPKEVDSRVIEMQFDNKNFEKNVSTSLSTLDKLKKALNLDNASKGLENVDSAANKLNFDKLVSAATALERRFSVFGEIGAAALNRVTNSMMDLSSKTLNFLTNGIVQGGLKRAMNLEQADFQLQGLLKDTQAVAAIMEDVSWSVDGTAYGLDAAAKAASMFAATGMRAGDQMKGALRGVAGVAAMTNSQYEDIAQIFTTVAGQGKVMADQYNQLASRGLNAAAVVADYLTKVGDGAKVTEAQVREMTSDGKISFATFAAAMDDAFGEHAKAANKTFNGAMSNIRAALSRIGADFISPIIKQEGPLVNLLNRIREKVNEVRKSTSPFAAEMTTSFNKLLTRLAMYVELLDLSTNSKPVKIVQANWQSFINVLSAGRSIIEMFGAAFKDVFPASLGDTLLNVARKIQTFTSSMKPSIITLQNLRNIFRGFFSVIDLNINLFSTLINRAKPLIDIFKKLGSATLSLGGSLGKWLTDLNKTVKETDYFNKAIDNTINVLKKAKTSINEFVNHILHSLKLPSLDELTLSVKTFISIVEKKFKTDGFSAFDKLITSLKIKLKEAKELVGRLKDNVVSLFQNIGESIGKLDFTNNIGNAMAGLEVTALNIVKNIVNALVELIHLIGNFDISNLYKLIAPFLVGGIGLEIKKFFEGITSFTKEGSNIVKNASGILGAFKDIMSGVKDTLKTFQKDIEANVLLKIAAAVGILAIALINISSIDAEKLGSSLGAITWLFADLMGFMTMFSKISGDITGAGKTIATMIGIAISLNILAGVLKKISNIDSDKIGQGLLGLTVVMGELVASVKLLGNGKDSMAKGAKNLIFLAASVKILASVCEDLAALNWEQLAKGLVGVGGLLGELDVFLNTTKNSKLGIRTATGLVITAAALKVLESVCKSFAKMNWEQILKGLVGVGGLLAELSLFANSMSGAKHIISSGLGIIEIAAAMKILADVMTKISRLNWEDIAKGLTAIGISLGEIALAVNFMPKNMVGISTGIVIISVAMKILADVMKKMSNLSWEGVAKGLVTIGVALVEFSIGLNFMKGTASGSASLILAAVGINLLTPALLAMSKLKISDIAKGLGTLAGVFVIFGAAGYLLKPVAGTIMYVSGAISLLATAIALLMTALAAFMASVSVSAFANSITQPLMSIGSLLNTELIKSLALLIPEILVELVMLFGGLIDDACEFLINKMPTITNTLLMLIVNTTEQLVAEAPIIARNLFELVLKTMIVLNEYAPKIIDQLFIFIIQIIDGLTAKTPELVKAAEAFIRVFFGSVMDTLKDFDSSKMLEAIVFIGLFAVMLKEFASLKKVAIDAFIGIGVAAIAIGEIALILAAIQKLDITPNIELVGEISVLLLAMTAVTIALAKLNVGVGPAAEGAAAFDVVVLLIGALIVSLGGLYTLMEEVGITDFLDKGIDMLLKIAEGIGGFIGKLYETMISELLKLIPKIGTYFSLFMINIQPFIVGARQIDEQVIKGITYLTGAILEITAAQFISGITKFFHIGFSMEDFAEMLIQLGNAMVGFSKVVSGNIDPEAVVASATAAAALAELQKSLPAKGGILQEWFGEKTDMDVWGAQLAAFGGCLVMYSKAVSADGSINPEAIQASANAAKSLAELQNNLPRTGGKLQEWLGEKMDLSTFGRKLCLFGEKLVAYSSIVGAEGAINPAAIEASAKAGTLLADLQNKLPYVAGSKLADWFGGQMDLESFGKKLVEFGKSLVDYCDALEDGNGIQPDLISNSAAAAKKLVELQESLPKESGWWQSVFGGQTTNIAEWGEKLVEFAKSLTSYTSWLKIGMFGAEKVELIQSSVDGAKILVGLSTILSESKISSNTLSSFGSQLWDFGENFANAATKLTSVSHSVLMLAIEDLSSLISLTNQMSVVNLDKVTGFGSALKDLADFGIDEFVTKFQNSGSKVEAAMEGFLNAAVDSVNKNQNGLINAIDSVIQTAVEKANYRQDEFKQTASKLMQQFILGLDSQKNPTNDKIKNILDLCLKTINSPYLYNFKNAGTSLWREFIKGVDTQKTPFITKIKEILDNGKKAINDKNSEYKVVAETLMDTFIKAIDSKKNKAKDTVADIIDNMIKNMSNKENKFKDVGVNLFNKLASGLSSKESHVVTTGGNVVNSLYNRLYAYGNDGREFYRVGVHYDDGIASGIDDRAWYVNERAKLMASGVDKAVRNVLNIRSPSRVAYQTGTFYGDGFVAAIIKMAQSAYNAAKDLGNGAKNGLSDAVDSAVAIINDNFVFTPVITPEVDPSNAIATAKEINSLFNGGRTFAVGSTIRDARSPQNQNEISEASSVTTPANNYQFIQNNYSPKALSRIDIYRQTKNQFNTFKEATVRA